MKKEEENISVPVFRWREKFFVGFDFKDFGIIIRYRPDKDRIILRLYNHQDDCVKYLVPISEASKCFQVEEIDQTASLELSRHPCFLNYSEAIHTNMVCLNYLKRPSQNI